MTKHRGISASLLGRRVSISFMGSRSGIIGGLLLQLSKVWVRRRLCVAVTMLSLLTHVSR